MSAVNLAGFADAARATYAAAFSGKKGYTVPARHQAQEEYLAALEYACAWGHRQPTRNHAGRWFTFAGEEAGMCRIVANAPRRHRCKDMRP